MSLLRSDSQGYVNETHRLCTASPRWGLYCVLPTGVFAVGSFGVSDPVVLDSTTHKVLHALKGHKDSVCCCAFSRDGRLLATASLDKTVKLFQVESGSEMRTLTGHTNSVYGVMFTADGKHIISVSWDETARVWDVASGTLLHKLALPGEGSLCCAVLHRARCWRLGALGACWRCLMSQRAIHLCRRSQHMLAGVHKNSNYVSVRCL